MKRFLYVTWQRGAAEDPKPVRVRRNWLWPFSRNVTFGRTIFEGGPLGMNDPTTRHELWHVRQYELNGWWWVWRNRAVSEADARLFERADYPKFRLVTQ